MSACQWLAEVIWWAQGTRQPRASGIAARTWRRRLVVRRRGVLTGVALRAAPVRLDLEFTDKLGEKLLLVCVKNLPHA